MNVIFILIDVFLWSGFSIVIFLCDCGFDRDRGINFWS